MMVEISKEIESIRETYRPAGRAAALAHSRNTIKKRTELGWITHKSDIDGVWLIPVGGGFFTAVDECDVEWLDCLTWGLSNKYVASKSLGRRNQVLMHRLVMRAGRGEMVDHKDRNRLNNTRSNLRICNNGLNLANSIGCPNKRRHTYKGVRKIKSGRWVAEIGTGYGKYIGSFDTEIEAAIAYNRSAIEKYGEFARLNTL